MNIGWIGLGKMGAPMSLQLLKAGHTLSVYNRTKEKESTLLKQGASSASSPKELSLQTDIVFTMVSDDKAIRNIFTGNDGILEGLDDQKIIINTSTVSPDISKVISRKCNQHNAYYIDAPVSGSVPQAKNKELVSMVGGDESTVEKIKPLLHSYSKEIVHIGTVGSGNAAKLAVNTFLGIITGGLAEVIQFVEQLNVSPKELMHIINNSSLHSPFVEMKGDAILEDDYEAAFTLTHLAKDLRLAKSSGFEGAIGLQSHDQFQQAETDLGNEDVIAIIKYLRKS